MHCVYFSRKPYHGVHTVRAPRENTDIRNMPSGKRKSRERNDEALIPLEEKIRASREAPEGYV
jgi:hypothetical protein